MACFATTSWIRQGWVTGGPATSLTTQRAEYTPPSIVHELPPADLIVMITIVSIRIVDVPRRPEAISIDRPHRAPSVRPREVELLRLLA